MSYAMHALCALVLVLFLNGCTMFNISLLDETQPLTERVISGQGKDKILLLDISGFISTEDSSSFIASPG